MSSSDDIHYWMFLAIGMLTLIAPYAALWIPDRIWNFFDAEQRFKIRRWKDADRRALEWE